MQALPASSFQSNRVGCDPQGARPPRQGCALTFQAGLHVTLVVLQGVVPLSMIFHHVELLAGLSHPGSRPTWGKKMGSEGWMLCSGQLLGRGEGGQVDRSAPPHFMEGRFLPLVSLLQQAEYPTSSVEGCLCQSVTNMHVCPLHSPTSHQLISKTTRWAGSRGLICFYAQCSFYFTIE